MVIERGNLRCSLSFRQQPENTQSLEQLVDVEGVLAGRRRDVGGGVAAVDVYGDVFRILVQAEPAKGVVEVGCLVKHR